MPHKTFIYDSVEQFGIQFFLSKITGGNQNFCKDVQDIYEISIITIVNIRNWKNTTNEIYIYILKNIYI